MGSARTMMRMEEVIGDRRDEFVATEALVMAHSSNGHTRHWLPALMHSTLLNSNFHLRRHHTLGQLSPEAARIGPPRNEPSRPELAARQTEPPPTPKHRHTQVDQCEVIDHCWTHTTGVVSRPPGCEMTLLNLNRATPTFRPIHRD